MQEYVFELVDFKHSKALEDYRNEMLAINSSMDGCSRLRLFTDMEKYVLDCKLYEALATCPPNFSLAYQYLYIDKQNNELIGMLNFRPLANDHPFLKMYGGHIGYSIRPKYRKLGNGTRMLKEFLPRCKQVGLDKVLITCLKDNIGSSKIIENNGGQLENEVYLDIEKQNIKRYWIKL